MGVTSICEFVASSASLLCVACTLPWQCVFIDTDMPDLTWTLQGVSEHWGTEGLQGCMTRWVWLHHTHLVSVRASAPGKETLKAKPVSWNNLLACACSRQRCWCWPRHNDYKEQLSAPAVSLPAHNRQPKPNLYNSNIYYRVTKSNFHCTNLQLYTETEVR